MRWRVGVAAGISVAGVVVWVGFCRRLAVATASYLEVVDREIRGWLHADNEGEALEGAS